MTNPRKFADKLEIIRRKEEEANAAFDKIMREVSDARMGVTPSLTSLSPHYQQAHMMRPPNVDYLKMRQKYKGGSLPNVNTSMNPLDFQSAFSGINDPYGSQQQHGYPGPIFPTKSKRSYTVTAPYRSNLLQTSIAEQSDSPSMWRRTFSDSAIQQSLQQPAKKIVDSSSAMNDGQAMLMEGARPTNNGARIVQGPIHHLKGSASDISNYQSSSPVQFNENNKHKNHVQMQANTNSLPDLSNLSIPSPLQTPLDGEQDHKVEHRNPFQAPYSMPPRRAHGKQMYRGSGNLDLPEHREKNRRLNVYPSMATKNEMSTMSGPSGRPLSPVASQAPFYWNNQPMSPLVSSLNAPMHPSDLQLFQGGMQGETNASRMHHQPPPYIYDSYDSSGYYPPYKNNSYRIATANPPPAHINNNMCDRQLDSALMKVKTQNELSEADLNSVGVELDPLDLRILSGESTVLVDQSTEEQFRMERAGYQ